MLSIAYRMVGSYSEAEDLVQESFLRLHEAGDVESPKAWLTTVTTRLAIDHLRSARVRREQYPGNWLPEPVVADPAPEAAARAESLSLAVLVLLESLTPVERAVFVLREAFDYGYDEIAAIVGKSEANCRQLAARARRHVDERRSRFEPSREQRDELVRRFVAALQEGDTARSSSSWRRTSSSTGTAAARPGPWPCGRRRRGGPDAGPLHADRRPPRRDRRGRRVQRRERPGRDTRAGRSSRCGRSRSQTAPCKPYAASSTGTSCATSRARPRARSCRAWTRP